jgi:hypothetical protein
MKNKINNAAFYYKKNKFTINLLLILLVGIFIKFCFYLYYNQFEYVTLESGKKYYLDVEKEFPIIFQDERHFVRVNMSRKLHHKYSAKRKEYNANEYFNGSREKYFDFWWNHLASTLEEDEIIDSLVNQINQLVKSGQTSYYGDDANALYATALVQNIPYDYIKYRVRISDTKYPYEVLYDNTGVCRETAVLLAKILGKMEYETSVVNIYKINHAVTGIKCPKDNENTIQGYCIIEPTGIRPIGTSDYKGGFWGQNKVEPRDFQFHKTSEGKTFSFNYTKRE